MNLWLFAFVPLLLFLVVPMDSAQAERLLLTGTGEIQKRVSSSDIDFEIVFNAITTDRRTVLDLESGFITVSGERHYMSPQSIIRDFANHKIIRVAGVLDNGNVFWIYGLKDGTNYEMFGKLITPENNFRIQFDGIITSLDEAPPVIKSKPPSILDYTPTLGISYYIKDVQFIQEDLTVQLKAHDSAKSIGGLTNNLYTLEGVKIKIDLEQNKVELIQVNERTVYEQIIEDEWKLIHSFEGQTNKNGDWTGGKLLTSGVFEPKQWMRVTITAAFEDQVVTEQVRVFVTEVGAK